MSTPGNPAFADACIGLHMTRPSVGRTRIAFGTFNDGEGLRCALADLETACIAAEQMGIAILASAFGSVMHHDGGSGLLADLTRDLVTTPSAFGPTLVLAGPRFWQRHRCFFGRSKGPCFVATWMPPHLDETLVGQMARGAIVLGVSPASLAGQVSCTRILLRHSSDRVQTHEFRFEEPVP
jgi:hypothetical protein